MYSNRMGMAYFEMCSQKFVGAPREMVYRDGRPGMSENPVNSIGLMVTSVSYQRGNEVLASFYNDNRNEQKTLTNPNRNKFSTLIYTSQICGGTKILL